MRKHLSTLLALVLALSLLLTCTVSAEGQYYNDPGTLPIVKEALTLTAGVPQVSTIEDWTTNEFTIFMEEQTGIHLEFETYPEAEYATKVDLIMAAGGNDLPEILLGTGINVNVVGNWGSNGFLIPLNDYLTNLAYYIPTAFAGCSFIDYETALAQITYYDGNIYGTPHYQESANDRVSRGRIVTYRPWLEQLEMEKPTSIAELRTYLEAIRDTDMNGDGNVNDEIPLSGYQAGLDVMRGALISPFTLNNGRDPWYVEDGVVAFNYNSEAYREALTYIHGLVADGLLDPMAFTQDQSQLTAIATTEKPTVGAFFRISQSNVSADDPKYSEYACYTTALAGPSGQRYNNFAPATTSMNSFITMNCEHPEAAFLMIDFLAKEEVTMFNRFGVEGRDWIRIDDSGVYVNLFDAENPFFVINNIWGKPQNTYWGQRGLSIQSRTLLNNSYTIANNAEDRNYKDQVERRAAIDTAMEYINLDNIVSGQVYNEEETAIMTDIWTPLETYISECFTRFCLGDLSLDAGWDEYIATLEAMGLEDCLAAQQSCYDRMFAAE